MLSRPISCGNDAILTNSLYSVNVKVNVFHPFPCFFIVFRWMYVTPPKWFTVTVFSLPKVPLQRSISLPSVIGVNTFIFYFLWKMILRTVAVPIYTPFRSIGIHVVQVSEVDNLLLFICQSQYNLFDSLLDWLTSVTSCFSCTLLSVESFLLP